MVCGENIQTANLENLGLTELDSLFILSQLRGLPRTKGYSILLNVRC